VKAYYARRAAEYDATSWEAFDETERATVERFVASLPPVRILDIGCGTGYLTRFLRGSVVGVDQSAEVLELARARCARRTRVFGDRVQRLLDRHPLLEDVLAVLDLVPERAGEAALEERLELDEEPTATDPGCRA
jgi:SAM-dependent methyltransferase